MQTFEPHEIDVAEGLVMRARRYPGGAGSPVCCIPGLTRNAADFEDIAPEIALLGHDVIVFNLRGRGLSSYDPDYMNYHPQTYVRDVVRGLDDLGIGEAIFIGTSLGGIITMLLNESAPKRVKAAVLNDIGPDLAPEGIARIAGYVGRDAGPAQSMEEAADRIRAINGVAFPDASDQDWLIFAQRTFRQQDDGLWRLDYDPNIGKALIEAGPAPSLWPAWEALAKTPTLVLRGEISDLLTRPIIEKMRKVNPNFDYVEVPRIGHAPMLTEPTAWAAVEAFISKVSEQANAN